PTAIYTLSLHDALPIFAAVLVPVFRDADGRLRIVLIVRTDRGLHGGQLAVPGGRHDPEDETLLATALREAREEIGLEQVEVLGEDRKSTRLNSSHVEIS